MLLLFKGTVIMRCSRSPRWGFQGTAGLWGTREVHSMAAKAFMGPQGHEGVSLSPHCLPGLTGV